MLSPRTSDLNFFGDSVASFGARSLDLLKQVDETVAGLDQLKRFCSTFNDQAHVFIDQINSSDCDAGLMDPEGKVAALFEYALGVLGELLGKLRQGLSSARADRRLTSDDGVVDGYLEVVEVVEEMAACLDRLSCVMSEHDIDCTQHEIKEENLCSTPEELDRFLSQL